VPCRTTHRELFGAGEIAAQHVDLHSAKRRPTAYVARCTMRAVNSLCCACYAARSNPVPYGCMLPVARARHGSARPESRTQRVGRPVGHSGADRCLASARHAVRSCACTWYAACPCCPPCMLRAALRTLHTVPPSVITCARKIVARCTLQCCILHVACSTIHLVRCMLHVARPFHLRKERRR
jgi:hypothetical protein